MARDFFMSCDSRILFLRDGEGNAEHRSLGVIGAIENGAVVTVFVQLRVVAVGLLR